MKADIWLARCAAELEHLHLTHAGAGLRDSAADDKNMDTAGALIKAQRYRGLDPVQAARIYWRDSTTGARQAPLPSSPASVSHQAPALR